ncbi:MAG: S8 family peptidase [Halieaceae bacterium]|nr:S8 family peptidase [Halieaceae bacterium]
MKARLFYSLLLTPLFAMKAYPDSHATAPKAEIIQVLLQGEDPSELSAALLAAGGSITHRLPIVSGIGGELGADTLESLREAPGVARVIEDFNPTIPPEPRTCQIDGALEVSLQANKLEWPVYNFGESPAALTSIRLRYPAFLGSVSVQNLPGVAEVEISLPGTADIALSDTEIPPGKTPLEFAFDNSTHVFNQNDFEIVIETADCEARLFPAYPDNPNDFYYATVTGASRLHQLGITGEGINVAVVDSGLWEAAEPLVNDTEGQPRVVARFDAIRNEEVSMITDESGHGSHMASVLAHSGKAGDSSENRFKGIAPDIGLIPVKVFDASGNGDFLDILRGIQWVLANQTKYDIKVLNLSLAAEPRFPYWDDPVNQAVMKAWQAGIVVVAAAGNEGPEWGSVGSPGNNPYVITVGAVTDSWTPRDTTDDYIPDFSSRGPTQTGHVKPDIVAPGGHMTGMTPPNSTMASDNPNWFLSSGDFVSTGSSQAAAAVAGIAALLLQVDSTLTNEQIKCLLVSSARPAINRDGRLSYSRFTQGAGYVDAARALTLGDKHCHGTPGDINAAVNGTEQLIGPTEVGPDGEPILPETENLISAASAAKGRSDDRRWGVKAHIERLNIDEGEPAQAPDIPIDWRAIYEVERKALLELGQRAPAKDASTPVKPRNKQNSSTVTQ